ncbi:pseudouridine synthase [Rhizosphaericola mali]|uniref:Pseudouridine synthase n=1 Tax=Rhizosphaericola mali TaxID=2545455 RepID=A0A5P2GCN5_9BACT|nr:pseudouridine synthase [Rhizosphaericola mali]
MKYYIVHKPFQTLSQFSPEEGKKTLKDYFNVPADVYPVGRLDYDSEGLLLLTNDKYLNHRLLNPKFKHPRVYWVQVEGDITQDAIQRLNTGVEISLKSGKYKTLPAVCTILDNVNIDERNPPIRFRKEQPTTWISLQLIEGKNRQVRKMTASVGFPTLRLLRFSIEKLQLEELTSGKMKEISREMAYKMLIK